MKAKDQVFGTFPSHPLFIRFFTSFDELETGLLVVGVCVCNNPFACAKFNIVPFRQANDYLKVTGVYHTFLCE
jgi:hypothetical protein